MISLLARGVATLLSVLAPNVYVDCTGDLTSHLSSDPVVNASLASLAHALYSRFGIYTAPLAASIILAEHIKYYNNTKNEYGNRDDLGEAPGVRDDPGLEHKCPIGDPIILGNSNTEFSKLRIPFSFIQMHVYIILSKSNIHSQTLNLKREAPIYFLSIIS